MGKVKLVRLFEPIIQRLELCAAVLAVEMADLIEDELDLQLNDKVLYRQQGGTRLHF